MSSTKHEPELIGSILSGLSLSQSEIVDDAVATQPQEKPTISRDLEESSYYDFDLAEFPWAIFSRSDRPQDLSLIHI